jgi:hypothetical protein
MKAAAAIAAQPSIGRAARWAPKGGCWSRMQDSLSSELLAASRNFYFNSAV